MPEPSVSPARNAGANSVTHAGGHALPAEPNPIAGARFRCSDGRVRTATHLQTFGDIEWIHTEDRSAWPAHKSERIDTSRILELQALADAASLRVSLNPDATDPQWRAALNDLGDAMRYLAAADPHYVGATEGAERVTFTGTLADLAPGDIAHVEGIRAAVLDSGTAEGSATRGDGPRWWADVIGVTEEDQRRTFRRPFAVVRFARDAEVRQVTIERPLSIR